MVRTEEDGSGLLCECGIHDVNTGIGLEPIRDETTEAWSQCEPPEPVPYAKPQWRRVAPYVAATALVCGTAAALLTAADQQYGTSAPASVSAQPVNVTSTIPATATVTAPPPATETVTAAVSPDDQWVVNALEGDDFIVTDPAGTVATVHRACSLIRQGETPRQAGRDIAAATHMSVPSASVLVSEAQWLYADACKAR